ncbi:EexN family lipoprotein [Wohlfahrtiimonas chitiniclastica]|uniref:EexN family lipoprotein n=1 Tax=Wohlfahrtiimonas chitiniclastica TaxID=400946 RepID=UPI0024A81183|nr:EexN family lipoprotein [Wohlfahrtiimonas chitiniclastica]
MFGFFPLLVIACSAEVKPVEYYENNMEETKAVLKKCEVTQGSQNDQNCLNAKKTSRNKYIAEQFKLPSWAKTYEE